MFVKQKGLTLPCPKTLNHSAVETLPLEDEREISATGCFILDSLRPKSAFL